MMRFLSRLMPRERRFFELFDAHVGFVVDGSAVLASALSNQTRVGVRPAVTLHASKPTVGWKIVAHGRTVAT